MDFAYPKLLYLLIIVPVIALLYAWARIARKRKLRRFGKLTTIEPLMPEASKYKPVIKITLQLIAVAAIIIALARPRGGEREIAEQRSGIEVMIAVDVSRSMLASASDDPNGISRLNRAKYLLGRLIDSLENDKVGLIIFAGNAYTQLPITNDFLSAKMYLNELTTDMVPTQGTDIGAAIQMALNGFTPDKDTQKAIIVITDTEDNEAQAVEMAKKAKESGVQVDVIGVGTEKGVPIPLNRQRGEYLKDYNGNVVTTALNTAMGRQIAEAGGGIYINGSSSAAVSEVEAQLDNIEKTDFGGVKYKASAEKFPIFIWIALLAIIADIFVLDRKIGWLQKINFFSKESK